MQIDYYYTLMSPWAYFGAPRFYELQTKYSFDIKHLPLDIMKLFPLSGGEPLGKRAEQRKAYRMMELKRWHKKLNMPINFTPKYFPPSDVSKASSMILSLTDPEKQNILSFSLLKYVWVEEKDIGDENNLREICNNLDLGGLAWSLPHTGEYKSLDEQKIINVEGTFWTKNKSDYSGDTEETLRAKTVYFGEIFL